MTWILTLAVLAVASGVFVQRTVRQPYTPCDFAVVYVAARHWVAGENPYDDANAMTTWLGAGGRADIIAEEVYQDFGKQWLDILVIPPSLPLLAPFALLPAPVATVVWWIACGGLFLGALWALISMLRMSPRSSAALLILAGVMLLAPIHECFGYGQPSLPSIGFIILGAWCVHRHREIAAGFILALATALKPQLGAFFALYYILLGYHRLALTFAGVMLMLGLIAIVPMQANGIPWLSQWLENVRSAKAFGGMNSPSIENHARAHLVNLQVILHGFLGNRQLVNLLAALITAGLVGVFAWQRWRLDKTDELLSLSIVGVLAVLPVYHRLYDATLMIIPLAWAVANLRAHPRAAVPVLVFVATFILPDRTLYHMAQLFSADVSTNSGVIWDALIEPHRAWILLIGFVLLIRAIGVPAPQRNRAHEPVETRARLDYSV